MFPRDEMYKRKMVAGIESRIHRSLASIYEKGGSVFRLLFVVFLVLYLDFYIQVLPTLDNKISCPVGYEFYTFDHY
jgi:hypothetical protein